MSRSASDCTYGDKPSEAYVIDDSGERRLSETEIEYTLCSWAHDAPEAVSLVGAPIWIQRAALSGAYMKKADCANCSAFKARGRA